MLRLVLLLIPADELVEELLLVSGASALTLDKFLDHRFQLLTAGRCHGLRPKLGIRKQPSLGGLKSLPALERRPYIDFTPLRTVAARFELIDAREKSLGKSG